MNHFSMQKIGVHVNPDLTSVLGDDSILYYCESSKEFRLDDFSEIMLKYFGAIVHPTKSKVIRDGR